MPNFCRDHSAGNRHDRFYDCSSENDIRSRNSIRNSHQRSVNVLQNLGDLREFYNQLQNFADLTHELFRQCADNRHSDSPSAASVPQRSNNKSSCCRYNCLHRSKYLTEQRQSPEKCFEQEESSPSGTNEKPNSRRHYTRAESSCECNKIQSPKPPKYSLQNIKECTDYDKCKSKSVTNRLNQIETESLEKQEEIDKNKEQQDKSSQYPERSEEFDNFDQNTNKQYNQKHQNIPNQKENDLKPCTCKHCQHSPDASNKNNIITNFCSDDHIHHDDDECDDDDDDSIAYTYETICLEPIQIYLPANPQTKKECTLDKNTQTFTERTSESSEDSGIYNKEVQTDSFDNDIEAPRPSQKHMTQKNMYSPKNSLEYSSEPNISSPRDSTSKNPRNSLTKSRRFSSQRNSLEPKMDRLPETGQNEFDQIQRKSLESQYAKQLNVEQDQTRNNEQPEYKTEYARGSIDNTISKPTGYTRSSIERSKQNGVNGDYTKSGYQTSNARRSIDRRNETALSDKEIKSNYETGYSRRSLDRSKENDADKEVLQAKSPYKSDTKNSSDIENNQFRDKEQSDNSNGNTPRSADKGESDEINKESIQRKPPNQIENNDKSGYETEKPRRSLDTSKENEVDKEIIQSNALGKSKTIESSGIENNQIRDKEKPGYETENTRRSGDKIKLIPIGEESVRALNDENRRPGETSGSSRRELPDVEQNQSENETQYKRDSADIKGESSDQFSEYSYTDDEEVEMIDRIVQTASYRNIKLEDLEVQTSDTLLEQLIESKKNKM